MGDKKDKVLYFAYASNLSSKRLHMNFPNATRIGFGKLMHYQLDFAIYSNRWHGASATIVENENRHVWGAIWALNPEDVLSLDRQEGVFEKIYHVLKVDVIVPEGGVKKCRVYQQVKPPFPSDNIEELAENRRPSAVYLNVIKGGAIESNLPEEYRKFLDRVPSNGYDGDIDINRPLSH